MSRTIKYQNFIGESIKDKNVEDLAGIGPVLGIRLRNAGFSWAYNVLGQFLLLKKNEELFHLWLNDVCQANHFQAANCYQCLIDWCDEFL